MRMVARMGDTSGNNLSPSLSVDDEGATWGAHIEEPPPGPGSIAGAWINFTYPDWHNAAYDLCSQWKLMFQKPRVKDP